MNPSTEEEYNSLPLGDKRPSFQVFGNAFSSTIQQICNDLALDGFQKAEVENVWTRHPNRQQQLQG
jgi:hypothetical protein